MSSLARLPTRHSYRLATARLPTRQISRPGPPSMKAEMSATDARTFCSTSPHAVIVTVWPTAHAQASAARCWVEDCVPNREGTPTRRIAYVVGFDDQTGEHSLLYESGVQPPLVRRMLSRGEHRLISARKAPRRAATEARKAAQRAREEQSPPSSRGAAVLRAQQRPGLVERLQPEHVHGARSRDAVQRPQAAGPRPSAGEADGD